ncbi:cytochrome b/b6 domain-containing protein [Alkalinema pantanalense CENA528]|uniref:cytochrome b/b6 domain-containing protein n=1 Tax=Alkalinema pantanalense TaxID=1620705 RepID=UPI003D6DFCDA
MATKPYQPLLLRLLHGVNSLLVILALISGYWVYNQFDGRWGKLAIPRINAMIDIHGTIGLTFFLFLPLFAIYSLTAGQRRLAGYKALGKLNQVNKPIWWVTLHRLTNTAILLAAVLAWVSGKLMDETWLPTGQLDHAAYFAHLAGWLVLVICLALHLLMGIKVGGTPLLLSMASVKYRPEDSPSRWPTQAKQWLADRGWLK